MNREWMKRLNVVGIKLTEEKDWVPITISQKEIDESIRIGNIQENDSKSKGLKDNSFDGGNGKSLERTIISKQAEFAVQLYGGGTARVTQPNEFHDYPDVGQVNVRYVFDKEDGLMIMKRDQGKVPMILVTGQSPTFYLMGWVIPDYAKYQIYKINLGREEPVAGFLYNMQDHEACTFSKQWLYPMWAFNRDLLK
jgi:hypothetical protein